MPGPTIPPADDVAVTRAVIAAPPGRIHRALTEPAELTAWLAERADVALPGTWAFWGRDVPEGDAPHQTPVHVDGDNLRFTWRLEDTDTSAEFALEPRDDDRSTLVTLSQTHFPGWPAVMEGTGGALSLLPTWWALAIATLDDHIAGRPPIARPDLTSTRMEIGLDIAADPDAVFTSLVDPDVFESWFGAGMGIEPRVGGRWAMGGLDTNPNPGTITEFEPGRALGIDLGGMVVRWELAGSAGHTRLTLVQSGFDEDRPPYDAWLGWLSGLPELRRYHELADWAPIWVGDDTPAMPRP
ncbi:MAG: hypothetical protein ABS81_20535 [Pseudonocardia sp. SCN 72-86]|nr:MAG: hypothetical protein ABS81_20535 [Pseudonocardia sp. SCN 72-86]